jgi:hypothetical protein
VGEDLTATAARRKSAVVAPDAWGAVSHALA